ncbi:MAG: AraC family transcriptional regulator [Chloroflexia bacterium]|nr:AraC family transcriptional regulator [Chloroflexia bacterium]
MATGIAARYNAGMGTHVDYTAADTWQRVAAVLETTDIRPAARCGNVRCEPGWDWRVDLTDHDLWLAVAGHGRFELEGEAIPIQPGTLFWLRPGFEGMATQDPASPLTVIYAHFDFFDRAAARPVAIAPELLPAPHVPLRDPGRLEMLLARIVRLIQMPVPLGAVEARLLLQQALLEVYRQDALNHGVTTVQPDLRIAAVLTHLHRHPAHRLSLAEAAALASLSPDHFSRLFRAHTGTSFRQYAVHARLTRARHLLEETTLTVGEVAEALGYPDVFLFSRQFKAGFGVAPSRIRDRHPDLATTGPLPIATARVGCQARE